MAASRLLSSTRCSSGTRWALHPRPPGGLPGTRSSTRSSPSPPRTGSASSMYRQPPALHRLPSLRRRRPTLDLLLLRAPSPLLPSMTAGTFSRCQMTWGERSGVFDPLLWSMRVPCNLCPPIPSHRYIYVWGIGQELVDQWAAGGSALEPLPVDADIKFHAFGDGKSVSAIDFLPSPKGGKNESQQVSIVLLSNFRPKH